MLILRPLSKRVPISTSTSLPSLSFSLLATMKLALAALSAAALASTVHAEQDDFVPTHLKAPLLEQFTDSCVPPSTARDWLGQLRSGRLLERRSLESLG